MSLDCDISEGVVFIGKDCVSTRFLDRINIIDQHFCRIANQLKVKESAINRLCPNLNPDIDPPTPVEVDPCIDLGCVTPESKTVRTYYLDATSINAEHTELVVDIEDLLCEALKELEKININVCQEGSPPIPPEEPGEEEEEGGGEEPGEEEPGEEEPPPEPCVLPPCLQINSDCPLAYFSDLNLFEIDYSDNEGFHEVAYQIGDLLMAYSTVTNRWNIFFNDELFAANSNEVDLCGFNEQYISFFGSCINSNITVFEGDCSEVPCIDVVLNDGDPINMVYAGPSPTAGGLPTYENEDGDTLTPSIVSIVTVGSTTTVTYRYTLTIVSVIAPVVNSQNFTDPNVDIENINWGAEDVVITLCEE
jgi:hypothetical protein